MTLGAAVLIMAKAPRPGTVKTRLAPLLGDQGCVELQRALISHTVSVACSAAPETTFLAYAPADARAELAADIAPAIGLIPQVDGHLGERLGAAVDQVEAAHPGPIVVIGTDIPMLCGGHLRATCDRLASGDDVVLGPACDGGYYLIAVSRSQPAVFDIDSELWGGPEVLAATMARCRAHQLRVGLLDTLRDLDTPSDAIALVQDPSLPTELRSLLEFTTFEAAQ